MSWKKYGRVAFLCYICLSLPIPLASIIIGAAHSDHDCQDTDEVGISLHQWLIGSGVSSLIMICILTTLFTCNSCRFNKNAAYIFGGWACVNLIFGIIYFGIGMALYFRSSIDCLTEGTSIGIMGLIQLIIYALPWIIAVWQCMYPSYNTNSDTTPTAVAASSVTVQQPPQPPAQQRRAQQMVADDSDEPMTKSNFENLMESKVSDRVAKVMGLTDCSNDEEPFGDDAV